MLAKAAVFLPLQIYENRLGTPMVQQCMAAVGWFGGYSGPPGTPVGFATKAEWAC